MSLKWSRRVRWTAASVVATCAAGLIYLLGVQLMGKGTGAWLTAFACLVAVVTLIAGIVVSDEAALKKRDWHALLQPRPIAMLFLAFLSAFGMVSTVVGLVEPTAHPPRIQEKIAGLWGEPGCAVTYRFTVRGQALIVDQTRRPPGDPPYRLVATITQRQGDVLEVRGEEPEEARGKAATFTYVTNGATERLTWDDQATPVPLELDRCA